MTYIPDPTAFLGPPNPVAGRYILTTSPAVSTVSAALGNASLRLLPWLVERTARIDRLGTEITVIGDVGSKIRLGIYADNGNCYPGTLVLDAGQINGDSATVQELTVGLTLSPGLYWIGGTVQAVTTTQPTVRVNSGWDVGVPVPISTTTPAANQNGAGVLMTGVTAALPSSFSTAFGFSSIAPRVFVRMA